MTVRAQQVVKQHIPTTKSLKEKVIEKTRREQDWTGTQLHAAGRLPTSSVHSMNARKCVHAQKPYPSQAFAHESSKVRGRGKREEGRQERHRPGG